MADAGYLVTESVFGPWFIGHPIDMHRVNENTSGSSNPDDRDYEWRAGGTMSVTDSDVMARRVPDLPFINHNQGGGFPAVHIRGVPENVFEFKNNRVAHGDPDSAIKQSGINGIYTPNENGYRHMDIGENQWGFEFETDVP